MRGVKKKTSLKKFVWFVNARLVGEKNGKIIGTKSNIVVKNAGETKHRFSLV
jgi:hypothetical protein